VPPALPISNGMETALIKIFASTSIAFVIGILITPLVTHFLYKYKVWKKKTGKTALDGTAAAEFGRLRPEEVETKTPRMGGIVIWGSVILTVIVLFAAKYLFPGTLFAELDFFSRSQTWIPLTTFFLGAAMGFLNDLYDISAGGERGIRLRTRLLFILVLSGIIGWWFYDKLDVTTLSVPFDGVIYLGAFIIPFFMIMTAAMYASGVIDGIDGLSGGVFVSIFSAYAGVAFVQEQYDLAALSATIAGATLAFLWFNIPPARFWMTETGTMALTLTLSVIVFMTDTLGEGNGVSLFLIIGLPLIATVVSNVVQVASKKLRHGKKVLRIAPLHHHFEAIGWPSYKVTMRYWVLSVVFAIIGLGVAVVA
jgi:phospho-N-acetylmuramoyl-pentapeptide-transferase